MLDYIYFNRRKSNKAEFPVRLHQRKTLIRIEDKQDWKEKWGSINILQSLISLFMNSVLYRGQCSQLWSPREIKESFSCLAGFDSAQ